MDGRALPMRSDHAPSLAHTGSVRSLPLLNEKCHLDVDH